MTIDDTLIPASGEGTAAHIWSAAALPRRLVEVATAGALAGVLMILGWLDLRPDLAVAAAHPSFWVKAAYPAAVSGCALVAASWLAWGRAEWTRPLAFAATLAGVMLVAGGVQAGTLSSPQLAVFHWPDSLVCMGNILVIAAPMLALTVAGLRGVELERPALTGFACGLFCGGVAATVDGLHCWQGALAFVGVWFTLAMLASGAIGAGAIKLLAGLRLRFQLAE